MNKRVQKRASVAPSTVEDIGSGKIVTPVKTKARNTPRNTGKSSKVKHTVVDMRVWKKAMQIAKGNRHRLEVKSATEIIVHNHADWKGYHD